MMQRSRAPTCAHRTARARIRLLGSVTAAVLLTGCAGGVSRQDAANFDGRLDSGDYKGAAQLALASGKIAPDGSSDNLAWSLDAGAALTYAGEDRQAAAVLDGAEKLMKDRDLDSFGNMGQYRYATYDGVMANTYKAIDFLSIGATDDARVEFNRLDDRQRRAEDQFSKEKAKLDAQVRSRTVGVGVDMASLTRNAMQDPKYVAAMRDVQNYGGYRPFINPLSTYLYGIYMITDGGTEADVEKGRRALAEVRGLVGSNPVIDEDIRLSRNPGKAAHTWVVVENGQAPTFIEYRLTLPIPLVGRTHGMSTVTVALPRMVFHETTYPGFRVVAGPESRPTATIGSFDRVMASEFQRRMPQVLAVATTEAIVKIVAQEAVAQTGNKLLQLAAAVGSNISWADTRSWTALPKQFEVARLDAPADGTVQIHSSTGADLGKVAVPKDRSSIVYVKLTAPGAPPAVQVLPL